MGYKGEKPKGSASKFFRPGRLHSAVFPTPSRRIPAGARRMASSAVSWRSAASATHEMGRVHGGGGGPDRANFKSSTNSVLRKEISSFSRRPASFGKASVGSGISPPVVTGRGWGAALGGTNRDDAGEDATTLRAAEAAAAPLLTPSPQECGEGNALPTPPSLTVRVQGGFCSLTESPKEPAGTNQPASNKLSNSLVTQRRAP